jgi:hypothetical protein
MKCADNPRFAKAMDVATGKPPKSDPGPVAAPPPVATTPACNCSPGDPLCSCAPSASPAPSGSGGPVGVQECDDYITKMEACMAKMGPQAKSASDQAMKQTRDAWRQAAAGGQAAKDALKTGCKAAMEALSKNPSCK